MESIVNTLKFVPVLRKGVVVTKIGEKAVVYPPKNEETIPYVLFINNIGLEVFSCINGQRNILQIFNVLESKYSMNKIKLLQDVLQFLHDLSEEKIIVWRK